MIYLDASAVATLYNQAEKFHTQMKESVKLVLENRYKYSFASSEWSLIEFGVAMKRMGLTIDKTLERLTDVREIAQIEPMQSSWISKALNFVYKLNLHSADAQHLAAAILLGCKVLVSCDKDLLNENVRKEFTVLSPDEFLEFLRHKE